MILRQKFTFVEEVSDCSRCWFYRNWMPYQK